MPAVQHWGRKESIIWPPRGYIYSIGAFFVALAVCALQMYVRFERGFTPLQKYYLPYYVRTDLAGRLHPADTYQLLYIADRRSLRRLALEDDVQPGVTLQAAGRPLPLQLTIQEAKNGSFFLVRGPLARYSNKLLHAWLWRSVYGGEPVYKPLASQLCVGLVVFGLLLPISVPKDIARTKELRYGRRLKGPFLVSSSGFTKAVAGDGIGITTNDSRRPLRIAQALASDRASNLFEGTLCLKDFAFDPVKLCFDLRHRLRVSAGGPLAEEGSTNSAPFVERNSMLAMHGYLVFMFFHKLPAGVCFRGRRTVEHLAASHFRIQGLKIADIDIT